MTLTDLLRRIDQQGGFLTESELTALADLDRLRQCLCRFGNGRFLTAAQNVAHFVDLIESTGKDYLRDVSLPASDPIYRGDYSTQVTPKPTNYHGIPSGLTTADAIQRAKPAPGGTGLPLTPNYPVPDRRFPAFNEADCGGVFDGFQVTSDADPGL